VASFRQIALNTSALVATCAHALRRSSVSAAHISFQQHKPQTCVHMPRRTWHQQLRTPLWRVSGAPKSCTYSDTSSARKCRADVSCNHAPCVHIFHGYMHMPAPQLEHHRRPHSRAWRQHMHPTAGHRRFTPGADCATANPKSRSVFVPIEASNDFHSTTEIHPPGTHAAPRQNSTQKPRKATPGPTWSNMVKHGQARSSMSTHAASGRGNSAPPSYGTTNADDDGSL
jgi:hypothetical protein